MSATAENAAAIAALTRDATDHLIAARTAIREAVAFAEDDYEHNADKLQDVQGALSLVTGTVAGLQYVWDDYSRERRKQEAAAPTSETFTALGKAFARRYGPVNRPEGSCGVGND